MKHGTMDINTVETLHMWMKMDITPLLGEMMT